MFRVALLLCVMGLPLPMAARQHGVQRGGRLASSEVVEVSSAAPRAVTAGKYGAVWVALGPVQVAEGSGKKSAAAGDFGQIKAGGTVLFHALQRGSRVVLVQMRAAHQDLTVERMNGVAGWEDASERNSTLLVAVEDSRIEMVRGLGDESEWRPGKAEELALKRGESAWMAPGVYHVRNPGRGKCDLVSIEW